MLAVLRNILADLGAKSIRHQSSLGPVKAGGCRQATTCNRAPAMMLLTGNPLSVCVMTRTRMLRAADMENVL